MSNVIDGINHRPRKFKVSYNKSKLNRVIQYLRKKFRWIFRLKTKKRLIRNLNRKINYCTQFNTDKLIEYIKGFS